MHQRIQNNMVKRRLGDVKGGSEGGKKGGREREREREVGYSVKGSHQRAGRAS